jgi:phosphatidylserine decarboxylase
MPEATIESATASASEATRFDRAFVLLQRCLPTRLLSTLMHRLARLQHAGFKNWLIGWFVGRYPVDLEEAEFARIDNYDSFNHFFTRALKPGARPIHPDPQAIVSPVDGLCSQVGRIRDGRLIQAKGHEYSLLDLLNGDQDGARPFMNGSFCTIYLAPFNYHRIHMPMTGRLRWWYYSPGRLFSVNTATARALPNLFTRNERITAIFNTDAGPLGLVMVGALFVGSMETIWAGEVTPPHGGRPGERYEPMSDVTIGRGMEMGRFNMGSTVILLAPPDTMEWDRRLVPGTAVKVGLRLGHWQPPEATMPIRKQTLPRG